MRVLCRKLEIVRHIKYGSVEPFFGGRHFRGDCSPWGGSMLDISNGRDFQNRGRDRFDDFVRAPTRERLFGANSARISARFSQACRRVARVGSALRRRFISPAIPARPCRHIPPDPMAYLNSSLRRDGRPVRSSDHARRTQSGRGQRSTEKTWGRAGSPTRATRHRASLQGLLRTTPPYPKGGV